MHKKSWDHILSQRGNKKLNINVGCQKKTRTTKNRREDDGVEGVHIVETRMFCNVCLKSSCLLICVHSWSLDLSQTLIQTIQILKEEKVVPKPWGKKNHPMSPVQLLRRPSPWVETFCFVCFFLVFSMFLPPWPKNASKPMEKHKKTKSFTPCHPSSFSSDLLHGSKLYVFFTEYVQRRMEL